MVKERTDGAGEENVLLAPPSVRAAVALVPALDAAMSLIAVSPLVEMVARLEMALAPDKLCPSGELCTRSLLRPGQLSRDSDDDSGVER